MLARGYNILLKHIPMLKDILEKGDLNELELLYKNVRKAILYTHILSADKPPSLQLHKGSDRARSDDTSQLKKSVIKWIDEEFGPSKPPLRTRTKDERGFTNDFTGLLLCPSDLSWDDER